MFNRVIVLCGFLLTYGVAKSAPVLPSELESVLRESVNAHPDAMFAKHESSAAALEVRSGDFRWYPKVFLNSTVGRRSVSLPGGDNSKSYSVEIRQSIWDGGGVDSNYNILKANQSASLSKEGYAKESIGTQVLDAYLLVLRDREALRVAQRNVKDHQDLLAVIERRNIAGLSPKPEVVLASSRLDQARATVELLMGRLGRDNAFYISVIGKEPPEQMGGGFSWDFEGGLTDVLEKVRGRSKVLSKFRFDLEAAEAAVNSKKSEMMPVVYASLNRTQYPLGGSYYPDETRVMVNFEWQGDIVLSKRYQVDAAEAKVLAAKSALQSADRQLVQTVVGYWEDSNSARKRIVELNKYSESSREVVEMFKKQFNIGRRSWPDVLNTLQDSYSSKSQMVEVRYQDISARLKLAFMLGEFDSYLSLP